MRVTKIRRKDGSKLTQSDVETVAGYIKNKLWNAGFNSEAYALGATSMKIGLHMSSFRIDTSRLGHNARLPFYNDYGYLVGDQKSPKGYKRTDVPTWDQRVEFNNIVNKCLDEYKLSANVKSGAYTVRSGTTSHDESQWQDQGQTAGYNADASRSIVTESEARERCNSDQLEAEHKLKMREVNRAKSKERRERLKLFNEARRVIVQGFYEHGTPVKKQKNGKKLTHSQFTALLMKLGLREQRRVRSATINATAKIMSENIPF